MRHRIAFVLLALAAAASGAFAPAANAASVLHEVSSSNNTRLRKVILGGTRGHRTLKVPAWRGIDA